VLLEVFGHHKVFLKLKLPSFYIWALVLWVTFKREAKAKMVES
jgi:hypothetical protein